MTDSNKDTKKVKPKDKPHYVNNRLFSDACVEYCKIAQLAEEYGEKNPIVTDYIAICFMKICEGLSHKPNFIRYTYRDEMVMDGVENCLKALRNYNVDAATRTGKPNAFSYFTQIAYFAFVRRIIKEKKQQNIKQKWMSEADTSLFLNTEDTDSNGDAAQHYVDELRSHIDKIHTIDQSVKEFAKIDKERLKKEQALKPKEDDEDEDDILMGLELLMKHENKNRG